MPALARRLALLAVLTLAAAACGDGASSPGATPSDGAGPAPADAWRTATLTDVRSGDAFTIEGLAGKLVAIEPKVLSPPSTPLILVGPDGTVIETHIGIRRADELEALFRRHLP